LLARLETAFYWTAHQIGITRLSSARYRRRAAILMYHGVTDRAGNGIGPSKHVPQSLFRRQMAYLASHCHVVPLDQLVSQIERGCISQPHTVAITFDDGYRNTYTQAFPILRAFQLPATVFLITGYVGARRALRGDRLVYALERTERRALSLDDRDLPLQTRRQRRQAYEQVAQRLRRLDEDHRDQLADHVVRQLEHELAQEQAGGDWSFLTWDQIIEMARGGISFGAHTENHVILTQTDPQRAASEVMRSKQAIEARLGQETALFAYPAGHPGDYDEVTKRILEQAGLRGAVLARTGFARATDHPLSLSRVGVSGEESYWHFVASVSGLRQPLSLIKKAVARRLLDMTS